MKQEMLRRFAYIETQLLWGGGLTASELGRAFQLARQNAQLVISDYRRQHPDNLHYDRQLKRHLATDRFSANYIRVNPLAFLDYQRGVDLTGHYYSEGDWADLPFYDMDSMIRPTINEQALQSIVAALRQQTTIAIVYRAKRGVCHRIISPHHLVFADYRYHLRAYCHDKQHYVDYVLSRVSEAIPADDDWVSSDGDLAWNRFQSLQFAINPELPEEVRNALAFDYGLLSEELLSISVREAMAIYLKRQMERTDWKLGLSLWVVEH